MPSGPEAPSCDRCGSTNLSRLVSRVAVHRSFGDSLDWSPDSEALGDVDSEDPRAMAQYLRRMKHEMGEEVTPEFEEMIDELESGELGEDGGETDEDDDSL